MPGQHPEDSVGDCIESVLDDNPDLSEEQAARICNASLKADLNDDQKAALIDVEKAVGGLETNDRAKALGRRVAQQLEVDSAGQKAVAVGQHQPVQPSPLPDIDAQDPPEEYADALEAEDFIIYGKASIEKFDRGGEKDPTREIIDLSGEAAERALDRFFDSEHAPGIISLAHDDIPVGRPLREHTLDNDTTVEVDGESYEYTAGEQLRTHISDGDGDGRPELWLLGNLANDTELHRKVRLGVLLGDLDGMSVTFGRNDTEPQAGGRRVTDWDLFSVTLAPSDAISNEGAEFDLAGFKGRYDLDTPPSMVVGVALRRLAEVTADELA